MNASLPNYSPRGAATAFPMPHAVSAGRILEPQPEGGPTYLQTPLIKGKVPAALSSYSPGNDVENIYKACHGAGTDNELLIKVLVKLGSHEIQVLQVAYKQKRQKDLVTLVDKETSGNYGTGIILLASGALQGDAYLLRQAPAESQDNMLAIFTELAVGRTKHDLATLREYVSAAYSMNLDDTILEALPKNNVLLRQAFRKCLLKGISTRGYDVTRDVNTLKAFFDSRSGENLGEVLDILLDSPTSHLKNVASEYKSTFYNADLSTAISRCQLDKAVQKVLLYAVLGAEDDGEGVYRDARRINTAIENKNELLLTIRLVRAHWDLARFEQVVAASDALKPGKGSLIDRVANLTAGWPNRNLRKLLKGIIKNSAFSSA